MKFPALQSRSRIALDYTADRILAAQSSKDAIRPSILAAGGVPCSIFRRDPSLGEAAAPEEGIALRTLLRTCGFKGRECAMTLPASSFLTDLAELPTGSAREVQESAAWEAVARFGIEREELVTRTLPLSAPSLSGSSGHFLILALRTATALYATDVAAAAGLEPVRLEHAALAAVRAIWRRERVNPGSGHVAALHVEDAWATLAVLSRAGLVSFHSFRMQRGTNPAAVGAVPGEAAIPLAGEAESISDFLWHPFAEQVLSYLRHLERQQPGSWPERLLATGPGASRAGLLDAVRSVCGLESHLWCPSREFTLGPLAGDDGNLFPWAAAFGSLLVDVPQPVAALQETMS